MELEKSLELLQKEVSYNHCHSEFSNIVLLDSIIRIDELIKEVASTGARGVCITDHEVISGHVRFIQSYKKLMKNKEIREDFRIGLGDECYVVDSLEEVRDNYVGGKTKFFHFIVVAKDKIGHNQIRAISSQAWNNSFRTGKIVRLPVTKEQIQNIIGEEKGHLRVSTSCLGGELAKLTLEYVKNPSKENKIKIHKFITWGIETFGKDNFYIEIQPNSSKEQKEYNKAIIPIAKAYGVKVQVATDAHYLYKDHRKIHEAYLKSRENEDREVGDFYESCYLMKTDEMWNHFKEYMDFDTFKEVVLNASDFIEGIEQFDIQHEVEVPEIDLTNKDIEVRGLFKNWYDSCEYIKKFHYSPHQQDRYFLKMVEDGFELKNQEFNDENIHRIDIEFAELWELSEKMGQRMSAYYNLVDFIVDIMWEIGLVGVSRGSVTGFYTAYLVDIHQMNPIPYKLPHWRHLERNKVSLADIDIDTSSRARDPILKRIKDRIGEDNVLSISAFKTEKSKSAVLTACRGWEVNNDEAQNLASLIPQERGEIWTLKEIFEGDESKGREPIKEFINLVDTYSEKYNVPLKDTFFMIEGLVGGVTIHASGINIYSHGYLQSNALMKAPNGKPVTAWNLHDSEYVGDLKFDALTTEAQDKLEVCVDLLLKHRVIEWQGSIRETYNKYLHPDVIDYTSNEMWDKCCRGEIIDLFQFVTQVGGQCIKKAQPRTLLELASANSIMRLVTDKEEQPIDLYVKYKNDIGEWYSLLDQYGLNNEEIRVLEKHLLPLYGVCDTQESLMRLLMDKGITNFTLSEADYARKVIGKKLFKQIEDLKNMYYTKGRENQTRECMLNYVWEECISLSLGYGFSLNHTLPYSCIALQEMNLYHFYNPLYWNCACLTVNAQATDEKTMDEYEYEDDVEYEVEEEVGVDNNNKNKSCKYDKIAKAIGSIQSHGGIVSPPYINKANYSFEPDVEGNQIIYSLKAISGIGESNVTMIIENRDKNGLYTSFDNFMKRVGNRFTNREIIALIKSGAFDEFESDRKALMRNYLSTRIERKTILTGQNLPYLIKMGVIPKEFDTEVDMINFKNYTLSNRFFYCIDEDTARNKKPSKWYGLSARSLEFFNNHLIMDCIEDEHYRYTEEGYTIIKDSKIKNIINKKIDNINKWLKTKEAVELYNEAKIDELWNKYCTGNISKWEMESLSFYHGEHELHNVNNEEYMFVDFNSLSEEPVQVGEYTFKGIVKPKYALSRICGTVIAKNNTKHIVSILTTTGVVDVKFYSGTYSHYNKQISKLNPDGSKTVIEKSWFKRGDLISVVGHRKDDMFIPKRYNDTLLQHTVQKIVKVSEDGRNVVFKSERESVDK